MKQKRITEMRDGELMIYAGKPSGDWARRELERRRVERLNSSP